MSSKTNRVGNKHTSSGRRTAGIPYNISCILHIMYMYIINNVHAKTCLLTALCALAATTAPAVTLRRMSSTEVAGNAQCLLTDHYGMMWIGTEKGLLQYDGYRFKQFKSDAYSPGILPSNNIQSLAEDRNGNIWIGTRNGLAVYNTSTGRFITHYLQDYRQQVIKSLFTSKDGTVWIGTDKGLTRYDAAADTFITYSSGNSSMQMTDGRTVPMLNIYTVTSIAEDSKGNLYIGTFEQGLFCLKRKTSTFVVYPKTNAHNSAYSVFVDSRDRLWIGPWENGIERMDHPQNLRDTGLRRFNQGRGDFRTFYHFAEDKATQSVWGCCLEGVTKITMDTIENVPCPFSNDILATDDGRLWVLTKNSGLIHFSTVLSPFTNYILPHNGLKFPIDYICSIYTSDGNMFWTGLHPFGLAVYDSATGNVTYGRNIAGMQDVDRKHPVDLQTIRQIKLINDRIWMASNKGILQQQADGSFVLRGKEQWPFMSAGNVNALMQQKNGTIWIGQQAQVSVMTPDGRGACLKMSDSRDDFSTSDVNSIMEDSRNTVWIATENNGVIAVRGNSLNPESLHFCHYSPHHDNFPTQDATACFEDSRHNLWAISNSGGLYLYDRKTDRFRPMNRQYHIESGSVYTIEEDAWHNLWITTEHALLKISGAETGKGTTGENYDESRISSYGTEDGLTDIAFTSKASASCCGRLYYGTGQGFFGFTPGKTLRKPAQPPRLVVTDILINDTPLDRTDSLLRARITDTTPIATRKITLPAGINKFGVEYALLTYNKQRLTHYAYKLDGYDREWHYTSAQQRQATYQNLPYGTYHLRLKAADSQGEWNEMNHTIEISVLPPWYRSQWACLFYALMAAVGAWGATWWYRRHVNTRNRLAMGIILANITHELLTPLTIISVAVDDMKNRATQPDANYQLIHNNIERLKRLLRQILEVRKSHAGQLRLLVTKGDLADFVKRECENIRPMAGAVSSEISIDCGDKAVAWFDHDKMDKILYNLLSNAIKYNKAGGKIRVGLTTTDGTATLTVSDEGIGISKEKMRHLYTRFFDGDYRRMNTSGTGIGLSLTRDLVKLHHGTIRCESRVNCGTTFSVTIPTQRCNYSEHETGTSECDNEADGLSIALNTGNMLQDEETEHNGNSSPHNAVLTSQQSTKTKEYSILIVEDNPELLEIMKRLLTEKYNVMTARNGQQALGIIQRRDTDIVITDVMMPVMDGMELTRQIKNSPDYAQLPVVMLTAKTTESDRNTGYECGADAYITKPFKMNDLSLRIENIIRNRERIRRKFMSLTEPEQQSELGHYSSPDQIFLQKATDCVKEHLKDSDYDRETFAMDMAVSQSTLYNKLRALTGLSVTGFINSIRLKEACRIARLRPGINVTELSVAAGFNTPRYFTKCFKKEFGKLPSEFIEEVKSETCGADAPVSYGDASSGES